MEIKSSGGASGVTVITDNITTVTNATEIIFVGATVTNSGGGIATVTITGSSPLTTKGDVYGYSSNNARVPIGADGTVLTADSAQALGLKWSSVAGTGDVIGPGSATDNAVVRFDGTTGKLIQNSAVTIADTSGNITGGTYNGNTIGAGATSGTNTGDQTSVSGNSGTVTVADAGGDTTTWPLLGTSQTGSLAPATDAGLTFNATTNALTTAIVLVDDEAYGVGWNGSLQVPTKNAVYDKIEAIPALTDGDKGDITVSSSGTVWTIDAAAITLAKMADLAQDQFIGRTTASTGVPQTATITAAARTVLDDTTVGAMVDTLGGASALGTGGIVRGTSPTITTAALGSSTATTQSPADNSTKIATTAYVDNAILGQRLKEAVKYASVAALPSIVYANGSSGVGATLTGVALAAISLDSSSPSVADRVLIKNQVASEQNGIYTVTATGSGAAVFVLTRAIDFDQAADIQTGDSVFVTAGSTLASTTWVYTGIDSPTMGTTALTFVQAAGPGSYTAGNGIAITGVSIAIDTAITVDKTTAQTLTNKTLTSPILTTPTLGTPASGVMTNVTGVPAAAILPGSFGAGAYVISTSLQVATIELGHATDTTLARVSAGVVSVEGVNVMTVGSTDTVTGTKTMSSIILPDQGQIKLTVPTTDLKATGPTCGDFNSGYSSSAIGDLVYLDSAATWQKADANTTVLNNSLLAIALEVKASGNALLVALPGSFIYSTTGFPTFTVGLPIFMSETAGAVTQTAPTTTDVADRVIGFAVHADKMYFYPESSTQTHT